MENSAEEREGHGDDTSTPAEVARAPHARNPRNLGSCIQGDVCRLARWYALLDAVKRKPLFPLVSELLSELYIAVAADPNGSVLSRSSHWIKSLTTGDVF